MRVEVGHMAVVSFLRERPAIWSHYERHATLVESFEVKEPDRTLFSLAVWCPATREWPSLVVTHGLDAGPESGFEPGMLFVPETNVALFGAGTCLLAYDLTAPRRLWQDYTVCGFWGWQRHGELVVMAAELELAVWDIRGVKQWSTPVEPPWNHTVDGDRVTLDVMGRVRTFPLSRGPEAS